MDALVPEEQLLEYERQLADVNELLAATPGDTALLSLKSDLEELLALTKASLDAPPDETPDGNYGTRNGTSESPTFDPAVQDGSESQIAFPEAVETANPSEQDQTFVTDSAAQHEKQPPKNVKKKSTKKMKEFEVPAHLLIHEADTEGEKNRKRRAIKALKNKYREKKKEVETEKKQQSWQSFQQKTLKRTNDNHNTSIFATQEGENAARVGVVSASRGMTEFAERKRHKHS